MAQGQFAVVHCDIGALTLMGDEVTVRKPTSIKLPIIGLLTIGAAISLKDSLDQLIEEARRIGF